MKIQLFFASSLALLGALLMSASAHSKILWQGDFETGDMSQWSTPINPAGHSVISDCVFDGKYAGKITLTGDESFLWHGNKDLNRSEFHHRYTVGESNEGSTQEGSDTFFARDIALLGYQDTLYVNSGRSWFDRSLIAGNVDYIFGKGNALFTHSEIKTLEPDCCAGKTGRLKSLLMLRQRSPTRRIGIFKQGHRQSGQQLIHPRKAGIINKGINNSSLTPQPITMRGIK